MTQLVERSVPTTEILGSNPVIGNFIYYLSTVFNRPKNEQEDAGMAQFFKKNQAAFEMVPIGLSPHRSHFRSKMSRWMVRQQLNDRRKTERQKKVVPYDANKFPVYNYAMQLLSILIGCSTFFSQSECLKSE